MASGGFRQRLAGYNPTSLNNTFQIKLLYGHTLTDKFYEHTFDILIPEEKLRKNITKIRIFLNLDMSNEENHQAEIVEIEYV
jgi:hypothetical protein